MVAESCSLVNFILWLLFFAKISLHRYTKSQWVSTNPQEACARQEVRLNIPALEGMVQCSYFRKGLASSTLASYTSTENRYLNFCSSQSIDPFPLPKNHLCYSCKQRAPSIWRYHHCTTHARGLPNLFTGASFLHLEYVLKGVKKTRFKEGRSQAKPRLPITLVILKCLQSVWSFGTSSLKHNHVMLRVA